MKSIVSYVVVLALTAIVSFARAADLVSGAASDSADVATVGSPPLKIGGFGTLGVSHSSQKLGDYVLDSTIPKGAGLSQSWTWGNDSRIGVQVTGNLTPKILAVFQVITEYQADSTYRPAVEWVNLKYAFSSDAYVRFGRIALPTFLYSDSRKVGYSHPWIHPPADLYRQLSATTSDGSDASYRFDVGTAQNSIRIFAGNNKTERPSTVTTSRDMWGIFDTLETGRASFRAGYQERESSSFTPLTGVTSAWIHNSDLSVGANYDCGDWFATSEWIQRKSTTKASAMYISAGFRINKFTPFLTYSSISPATFLPGYPAPTATAITSANRAQQTASLGVRWDFMKHTDLKLQYDMIKLSDNSNGYLANVPTGITLYGTRFHVISTVVDFSF